MHPALQRFFITHRRFFLNNLEPLCVLLLNRLLKPQFER